ncbi:MAG: ABC transporter permease [Candidatus Cyclobacteriaceae bacterium M2_1C_046]
MWKYHFKTSFRNLLKNRFFTLNNVIGLALGFASFFFIYHYSFFEKSFDSHIKDRDRIYRVTVDKYREGELIVSGAETYVGCGPAFTTSLPEIETYTRTHNTAVRMNSVITYQKENGQKIALKLKDYYYADSTFLKFFGYELLKGDLNTALNAPHTAVITEELAHIYFGDEDPIGKTLIYEDENFIRDEHVITGIMKNPPLNSHLPFSLLLSYNTFDTRYVPGNYKSSWKARKSYTYLKTHPQVKIDALEVKLNEVAENNRSLPDNITEVFKLQALTDIHFTKGLEEEPTPTVDRSSLDFIFIVSVLVLVIAFINYINLTTSNLIGKTTDIGIKKVLGATEGNLMMQHYIECFLINILALIFSLGILIFSWYPLNELAGVKMPLNLLFSTDSLEIIFQSLIVATLVSGTIPAIVLAGINPIKALTGKISMLKSKYYRMALTIGQFALSFALITATLIVYLQLNFMQEQELGVDIKRTLVLRTPGILPSEDNAEVNNAYNRFLNDVSALAVIEKAAASLTIPGHEKAFRTGVISHSYSEANTTLRFNGILPEFIETFDMKLIEGRNFRKGNSFDNDSTIILSESAVKKIGFNSPEEAIGSIVEVPAFRLYCEVIGVVNDYRLESVKSEIEPTAFIYNSPTGTNFFSLKLINNASGYMGSISKAWNKQFPGNPIDYFFLEDYFNKQYHQEKQLMQLFAIFGVLAISLATFGLIGLSIFTLKRKLKEIGIRKVLGSTVGAIFLNVALNFILLVIFASLLGAPLAYYFGADWLETFPQRIILDWKIFVAPALLLLLITFAAVAIQTLKAANTNPARVLRTE